jgi:hypothetical protein
MVRRVLALLLGALVLTACQVDIAVDVDVEPDGSGTITVIVTADAEVVQRVPTLADDLVLDDATAAGWIVDGPNPTPEGGLTLTLVHDFEAIENGEATNLLQSLGPPFNDIELRRGTSGDVTTNQLRANLGLTDGFNDFADDELVSAVGAVPFAEEIAASGATPATSMSGTLTAFLPGEIVEESTNGALDDEGRFVWTVPFDGPKVEARAVTEQSPSDGGVWARPLSIVALIALILWVGFMTIFVGYVAIARFRRARRRSRRQPA